jgi:hypothetical protein
MKRHLSSADLRHKIDILQIGDGGSWQLKFSTFAKITHLMPNAVKAFEDIDFAGQIHQNYMLFCIRFNKNIDKNMRVRLNEKDFLIKKITNYLEKDDFLELIALQI